MNNLDLDYRKLLTKILESGVVKGDRTGVGTKSIFGYTIRHKMSDGFPLLTTKKMAFKTMVTELLWFLRGDTNIKFLVDNGCHIWDGDAYKNYQLLMIGNEPSKILSMADFIDKIKNDEKFAKHWGDLGPIYGSQWRDWGSEVEFGQGESVLYGGVDQIQNLINDLKTNPDSRRLMVNAWNVKELDQMVLPPCHYGFQVYTRELSLEERRKLVTKEMFNQIYNGGGPDTLSHSEIDQWNIPSRAISLAWNQRSVDTFLGLPFNIASYGLLLAILAKEVNMVPDELIGNLGDVHLYLNHLEAAKQQIGRKYTHEEREKMLIEAMGKDNYDAAIKECMPFSGGLSGYYEYHEIPYHNREPYSLPKLVIENFPAEWENGVFKNLEVSHFRLEKYNYHSTIKADLNN
jgi:thymidylate synthase